MSSFIASARNRFAGFLRGKEKRFCFLHPYGCRYKRWLKATHSEFVLIVMRVHLFPSRTQKLSSCTLTILAGRLAGKISNANTKASYESRRHFLWIGTGGHLFPVAVPDIFVGFEKPSSAVDRCHSLRSLLPPLAALPSLPNPNTEVKLTCADNTWRATGPVCGARHPLRLTKQACVLPTAAQPATPLYLPPAAWGSGAGKIGNANTKLHLKKWSFSFCDVNRGDRPPVSSQIHENLYVLGLHN